MDHKFYLLYDGNPCAYKQERSVCIPFVRRSRYCRAEDVGCPQNSLQTSPASQLECCFTLFCILFNRLRRI